MEVKSLGLSLVLKPLSFVEVSLLCWGIFSCVKVFSLALSLSLSCVNAFMCSFVRGRREKSEGSLALSLF